MLGTEVYKEGWAGTGFRWDATECISTLNCIGLKGLIVPPQIAESQSWSEAGSEASGFGATVGKTVPQESIRGEIGLHSETAELRALRVNCSLLQSVLVRPIRV